METKKWYQSKTIWGIFIAFMGFLLQHMLKVDISLPENADYDTIMTQVEAIKANQSNTMVLVSEIMSLIGTLLAIYGRIKAEEKLSK